MNLLFVQESLTGTGGFFHRIEPSVVNFPISVSEGFIHIPGVGDKAREFPIRTL
jgi:hypothetical protein